MRILTWRVISAWPDPLALRDALGAKVVKQRAAKGEGETQFSQGCLLVDQADCRDAYRRLRQIAKGGCRGWHFAPHSFRSLTNQPRRVDVIA